MRADRFIQRRRPIERLGKPFEEFTQLESAGGIILIATALVALVWANSTWSESYFHLWENPFSLVTTNFALSKSLHHWINDGLMVIFFFVVGLEIKREVLVGELASVRKSAVPIAAALGGMVVPALFYALFNYGTESSAGWGIPMATDIAFALGVLALLGSRIPPGLKVFLTALAIVDDLGAVLVIAVFYSEQIVTDALVSAALILFMLIVLNWAGVRRPLPFLILGIILWFFVYRSGVHATVAGVLLAMTIPSKAFIDVRQFRDRAREILNEFDQGEVREGKVLYNDERQGAVHELEMLCEKVETPLQRFEHSLHPWVSYLILPIFALSNAGVALTSGFGTAIASPASFGIGFGLVLGKPIGILLFSWLAVKSGFGALAEAVDWMQMLGVSFLAGIGFTMSLFIANLAFGGDELLETSKIAILTASLIAGIIGMIILALATSSSKPSGEQASSDGPVS